MCGQTKDDVGVGQQCISEAQVVVENCLFLAPFSIEFGSTIWG
jgi:hypothetical protein